MRLLTTVLYKKCLFLSYFRLTFDSKKWISGFAFLKKILMICPTHKLMMFTCTQDRNSQLDLIIVPDPKRLGGSAV